MDWEDVVGALRLWHAQHDREAARGAIEFLEVELRLMIPPIVRRRWPQDLIEDALRAFLLKLLEVPLPEEMGNPRSYLRAAFRNHCIDLYEARRRRREEPLDEEWHPASDEEKSPASEIERRSRAERLHAALGKLEIAERIALKLEHAPEWMTDDEVAWLGRRLEMDGDAVRRAVGSADGMFELSRVFDPGDDDPADGEQRRRRMERFRRRRSRAREKLLALLREGV